MTTNNLTLDNWKDKLWKSPSYELFEEAFDKLLELQHQQLIEQFKNMESMKKVKYYICDCGADEVNQKIDEILNDLENL